MTSLADMTAAPLPLRLGDELYWMTPLTLADYGAIERAARDGSRRSKRRITPRAMACFMSTREGMALVLWLALRKNHPALALADCRALATAAADPAALATQLDRAGGLPRGNDRGQAPTRGEHRCRRAA